VLWPACLLLIVANVFNIGADLRAYSAGGDEWASIAVAVGRFAREEIDRNRYRDEM
jgi:hypothetical protein